MTGAMERARADGGRRPRASTSDADAWNAKFTLAMKPQNATTVIADLQQSFANYLRAAKAPDDRFGEGRTVNRLLEAAATATTPNTCPRSGSTAQRSRSRAPLAAPASAPPAAPPDAACCARLDAVCARPTPPAAPARADQR
jgi:hypothetical protein